MIRLVAPVGGRLVRLRLHGSGAGRIRAQIGVVVRLVAAVRGRVECTGSGLAERRRLLRLIKRLNRTRRLERLLEASVLGRDLLTESLLHVRILERRLVHDGMLLPDVRSAAARLKAVGNAGPRRGSLL